uniref:Uncharacterized protein n=1 Tax=Anguilla anguilla TaxID=7936 RepID=A0A0E9PS37_ANGAN
MHPVVNTLRLCRCRHPYCSLTHLCQNPGECSSSVRQLKRGFSAQ